MLEHLFGSKTRLKLLRIFFRDPGQAYFVRELSRMLGSQINAVRREIDLLMKADIIKEVDNVVPSDKSKAGSSLRKYYSLNAESILYPELQALLIKAKVLGEQEFVTSLQKRCGSISLLLLTGCFTGDTTSPSDALIVGKVKERVLSKLFDEYEKELGCPIRYTVMSEDELYDRREMMDKFLYGLFEGNHVVVVDKTSRRT